MRTAVTLLLAASGLGVLAWLVLASGDLPPAEIGHPQGTGALEPPPGGPSGDPPGWSPASGPQVLVELTPRGRLLPPPSATRWNVVREESVLPAAVTVLGGADDAWFGPRRGGRSLVRVELGRGAGLVRVVAADAGDATALVDLGADTILQGRVVDTAGRPVAGARVWSGLLHGGELQTVATDQDGRFQCVASAGAGVPLVVRAPGLAQVGRIVHVDPVAPVEHSFVLPPGASLTVRCAAVAHALAPARVLVLPGTDAGTEVLQFPFLLQAVAGWRSADAGGVCTIPGLPLGGALAVLVQHPLVAQTPAVEVVLRQPENDLTVPLVLLPPLHGRVVDTTGAPVAGARVICGGRPEEAGSVDVAGRLLPGDAGGFGLCVTVTDEAGRFAIGRTGRAGHGVLLRVVDRHRAGLELLVGSGEQLAQELPLAPWSDAPAVLRLLPPVTGPWQVRVRPLHQGFHGVAAGAAFAVELREPTLLDVALRSRSDGDFGPAVVRSMLPVAGDVAVPTAAGAAAVGERVPR